MAEQAAEFDDWLHQIGLDMREATLGLTHTAGHGWAVNPARTRADQPQPPHPQPHRPPTAGLRQHANKPHSEIGGPSNSPANRR
jgi:hypothetical protein